MEMLTNVVSITIICYLVGMGFKLIPKINDQAIPVLVGIVGAILGAIGMYIIPDYPAKDIVTAIAVGIVSGLASTGSNQIYKQLLKFKNGEEEK